MASAARKKTSSAAQAAKWSTTVGDHQDINRSLHEAGCSKSKEARAILEKEGKTLCDLVDDGSVPDDLFVEGIGYFGAIPLTEPYTLARYQLAKTLLLCFGGAGGLVDAVQTALDQLLDIFWLNRGDRKDVRLAVPALFIRLNKDQEAYDLLSGVQQLETRSILNGMTGLITVGILSCPSAKSRVPTHSSHLETGHLNAGLK